MQPRSLCKQILAENVRNVNKERKKEAGCKEKIIKSSILEKKIQFGCYVLYASRAPFTYFHTYNK
jgi:hypothetical protein